MQEVQIYLSVIHIPLVGIHTMNFAIYRIFFEPTKRHLKCLSFISLGIPHKHIRKSFPYCYSQIFLSITSQTFETSGLCTYSPKLGVDGFHETDSVLCGSVVQKR